MGWGPVQYTRWVGGSFNSKMISEKYFCDPAGATGLQWADCSAAPRGTHRRFFMCLESVEWCQGRSRSYQSRPCKDCCFLSAKSRDTNKDTNTLRHSDMSDLPPKADIHGYSWNVRFVPGLDMRDMCLE